MNRPFLLWFHLPSFWIFREPKRYELSTTTETIDDVLLDDLDSSAHSAASPVSKRAALRDIQTQTSSSAGVVEQQQFVRPKEVPQQQPKPSMKHTNSVMQFIAGLEARARVNALMRSAYRRSKSVLDFNAGAAMASGGAGGATSLEARHASIRQLFANLASSSAEVRPLSEISTASSPTTASTSSSSKFDSRSCIKVCRLWRLFNQAYEFV